MQFSIISLVLGLSLLHTAFASPISNPTSINARSTDSSSLILSRRKKDEELTSHFSDTSSEGTSSLGLSSDAGSNELEKLSRELPIKFNKDENSIISVPLRPWEVGLILHVPGHGHLAAAIGPAIGPGTSKSSANEDMLNEIQKIAENKKNGLDFASERKVILIDTKFPGKNYQAMILEIQKDLHSVLMLGEKETMDDIMILHEKLEKSTTLAVHGNKEIEIGEKKVRMSQ